MGDGQEREIERGGGGGQERERGGEGVATTEGEKRGKERDVGKRALPSIR